MRISLNFVARLPVPEFPDLCRFLKMRASCRLEKEGKPSRLIWRILSRSPHRWVQSGKITLRISTDSLQTQSGKPPRVRGRLALDSQTIIRLASRIFVLAPILVCAEARTVTRSRDKFANRQAVNKLPKINRETSVAETRKMKNAKEFPHPRRTWKSK